jgi:hypothetical protein
MSAYALYFQGLSVLEVILGVATKVMSNYTNHIAHTQLDSFMRGNEWTRPAVKTGRLSRCPRTQAARKERV